MPKIQENIEPKRNTKQFRITIPLEIMKLKGWNKGQSIVFSMQQNGDITLKEL